MNSLDLHVQLAQLLFDTSRMHSMNAVDIDIEVAKTFRSKLPHLGICAFLSCSIDGDGVSDEVLFCVDVDNKNKVYNKLTSCIENSVKNGYLDGLQPQADRVNLVRASGVNESCYPVLNFVPLNHESAIRCVALLVDDSLFIQHLEQNYETTGDPFVLAAKKLYPIISSIMNILDLRDHKYCMFSRRVSNNIWIRIQAHKRNVTTLRQYFSGEVKTVTLSLDLRKSTYVMKELGADGDIYADWLVSLLDEWKKTVHSHLGVFDKFTGDGIIGHFLYDSDDDVVFGDGGALSLEDVVINSILCALELMAITESSISQLNSHLPNRVELFGPGIGIALAGAHWKFDEFSSVCVVGPGVVHACKMSFQADAKYVYISTNASEVFKASCEQSLLDKIEISHANIESKDGDGKVGALSVDAINPKDVKLFYPGRNIQHDIGD